MEDCRATCPIWSVTDLPNKDHSSAYSGYDLGPIIRINPYELHINDPEYYDELYVGPSTRRTLKYEWAVRGFGPTNYAFATISHELHRTRRGAIAPFFSKTLVQQLEPSVVTMIQKLVNRLEKLKGTGTVVNLIEMYPCLTSDIICQYAFASPYGYLDMPEFAPLWHNALMDASEGFLFFSQFPWLETLMRKLPQPLVRELVPNLSSLFLMTGEMLRVFQMVREKVDQVQADLANDKKPDGQRTIFHDLFTNDSLSPEEKTPERLAAEGFSVVGAGSAFVVSLWPCHRLIFSSSQTVAHTLAVISYHLIANPDILKKLQDELAGVMPTDDSTPKWSRLEQLPYMGAIIQEGLRVSCGVSHRLQRISPDIDLTFKASPQTHGNSKQQAQEWIIPKGTPVGMTSVLLHFNPSLFPDPHTFSPDRWLGSDAGYLRRFIVPFSKGSRQCLGMNLAYCELYLTLATLFAPGRFHFELFETGIEDVEVKHDFFNASQSLSSKGIRVKVF
ncbi:MAG: hypothetical protein Q9204_004301 [Flavoplaca sp. TL-2023a]